MNSAGDVKIRVVEVTWVTPSDDESSALRVVSVSLSPIHRGVACPVQGQVEFTDFPLVPRLHILLGDPYINMGRVAGA